LTNRAVLDDVSRNFSTHGLVDALFNALELLKLACILR
jgi:hypothetical protein